MLSQQILSFYIVAIPRKRTEGSDTGPDEGCFEFTACVEVDA
jgi:hypothetical protein